jgi:DNA invertase Pin-like site-specific DNA recombinase
METNPLKGLRCVGLGRTSLGENTEASIPQQTAILERRCAELEMVWVGLVPVSGVSGSLPGKREDIEGLLERKLKHNDYDVLMVQDRSRLTRSGEGHGAWLQVEFARVGVRVISSSTRLEDLNNPHLWIMRGLEDEASRAYAYRVSHDTQRGRQKKKEEGTIAYCLTPPFGIDRLYSNANGRRMFIIHNLRDGSQRQKVGGEGDVGQGDRAGAP